MVLDKGRRDAAALGSFLLRLERRTLAREILSALGGPPLRPEGWAEEFRRAARHGSLVFEEIPNTRASIGAKSFEAPTPDPAPLPKQPTKTQSETGPTFFEVDVVDEIGDPIGGVPVTYDVQGETAIPTDGAGHTRLDGVTAEFGTATLADLDALRDAVRSRWDIIRDPDWVVPEADATVAALFNEATPHASILGETLHTMVIQPWVIRARLVGHCFDTNKAFILPAAVETVPGLALDNALVGDSDGIGSAFMTSSVMVSSSAATLGLAVEVVVLDAPGLAISRDFSQPSENKASGNLKSISIKADFVCFLCAGAKSLVGGAHPGEHSYVAVAAFEWAVSATAVDYDSSPKLNTFSTSKGVMLNPGSIDARDAQCETRGPGSLIAKRAVLTY